MSFLVALAMAAAAAPAGSCQAALAGGTTEEALPGRVDGTTLRSAKSLVELRRQRGDALITIVGGAFQRADFRVARLHNICFLNTDLSRTDWRGAEASGIGFIDSNLEGADLRGARMAGILLRQPNLKGVDATAADWSDGRIEGGIANLEWGDSLENLRLDDADLEGFVFECGITTFDGCPGDGGVSLRGADLTGADIDSWWGAADFRGARLDRTEVGAHQLARLRGATFAGPLLIRGGDAVVSVAPEESTELLAALPPIEADDATAPVDSPSFDCAAARSRVERMICAESAYGLRESDRDLAAVYRRALAADPGIARSQRLWLAERDRCPDSACVERAYLAREAFLSGRMGPPSWLRPGVRALLISEEAAFDEAFRRTPLYRRLLPAIVGSAPSQVAIRVNRDGTIDAAGEAIGGNAHMCSLGGRGLRFDPATGWFSGPWSPTFDAPPDLSAPPMRVLRFDGERVEVFRDGRLPWESDPVDSRQSDYASCGARASFAEMVRVPVDDAEVDAILAELEAR